jgi:hypothetical protein
VIFCTNAAKETLLIEYYQYTRYRGDRIKIIGKAHAKEINKALSGTLDRPQAKA